jgi:hypothetical protein
MSAFQAKYQDLWLLHFDAPQGPRRDPGFDYNYESPKGSYTDLITRLLWELAVDLSRGMKSVSVNFSGHKSVKKSATNASILTDENRVRTEPLPLSFRRVVYRDPATSKTIKFRHNELSGVSTEHPVRDLISLNSLPVNWVIDQIRRHGYLLVGRCINSNVPR